MSKNVSAARQMAFPDSIRLDNTHYRVTRSYSPDKEGRSIDSIAVEYLKKVISIQNE